MKAKVLAIKRARLNSSWRKPSTITIAPKSRDFPHAQLKNVWEPYNKVNPQHVGLTQVMIPCQNGYLVKCVLVCKGCACKACIKSLRLLSQYNPSCFKSLVYPETCYSWRKPESLPEHVHIRRRLAYSIGNFRF